MESLLRRREDLMRREKNTTPQPPLLRWDSGGRGVVRLKSNPLEAGDGFVAGKDGESGEETFAPRNDRWLNSRQDRRDPDLRNGALDSDR